MNVRGMATNGQQHPGATGSEHRAWVDEKKYQYWIHPEENELKLG